ncbi:hypothetical protein Tco_0655820 [Tanacetum coccineum]|uniref:Uncharacterized protein n=1 Tax=Tanacetum coccineum TaxID=301880 RepID=A0ABQ4X895_9ASTR
MKQRESLVTTGSSRTGSLPSGHIDLTSDEDPTNEDPTDEDGDIEIGDSTEVSISFGDEIFSKGLGKMFSSKAGEIASKWKITVVTLVEEQMSPWKGNLPKLPIESNIARLATTNIGSEHEEPGCTLPTEGMRSFISPVSISLEGFLPSILLLMVIIVAVVIVTVIWVVISVDVIVGVVIVVAIIGVVVVVKIIGIVVVVVGGVPFIIKLLFVIIGFLHRITLYYLVH